MPISVGGEGDFGHFWSSEEPAGGINRLATYDCMLMLYSDLAGTIVVKISREIRETIIPVGRSRLSSKTTPRAILWAAVAIRDDGTAGFNIIDR